MDYNLFGNLTTRVVNNASVSYFNKVFEVKGSLEDVNQVLSDVIFIPAYNQAQNFYIHIYIYNH